MTIGPKWRTALYSLLGLGSAVAIAAYVNVVSRVDPFAAMRGPAGSTNPIEIELHDVTMKSWKLGKLVTSGRIGRIDVHRDHQVYELFDVTNGVYKTNDGVFHYDGSHGTWYSNAERLEVDGGAHVIGKEFDLRAPSFKTEHATSSVTVPGPATGMLAGGRTTVQNVVYHLANDTYETGPITWEGKFALNIEHPDQSGPASQANPDDNSTRLWKYRAELTQNDPKNKNLVHLKGVRGTDDDSIIVAPEATYDRKANVITCTKGPVKYWGVKANLVCDNLIVDRKRKIATATGNVVIYIKPEEKQTGPDDKMEVPPFRPEVPDSVSKARPPAPMSSDQHSKDLDEELRNSDTFKKYPATVRAEKIVYYYNKGSRHADITGDPQAQQELAEGRWRMVWTDHAFYDGEKDLLTLFSKTSTSHETRMKDSIGDDATAVEYTVSTKEDDDFSQGKDEIGTIVSIDDDANEAAGKAGKSKAKDAKKPATPPTKTPPGNLKGPIGAA